MNKFFSPDLLRVFVIAALVITTILASSHHKFALSAERTARSITFEEDSKQLAARFTLQLIKGKTTEEVALNKIFHTGDRFRFIIRPNNTTYLYVVNITPNGEIRLIWPAISKLHETDNLLNANQLNYKPHNGSFKFEGPTGDDWLLVILSKEKKKPDLGTLLSDLPKYRQSPGQVFEYKNQSQNQNQNQNKDEFEIAYNPKSPTYNPRGGNAAFTDTPEANDSGVYGAATSEGNVTLVYPYLLKHQPK